MLESQKQALRFRRAALSNAGTLVNVLLCMMAARMGYFEISLTSVMLLTLTIWCVHLLFVIAIGTGWNLVFNDPSLTAPQMVWVTLSISLIMYFVNDIRSLMMMGYLLTMAFGAFRLNLRGFYFYTFFALSCYMVVLYAISQTRPQQINLSQELFIFFGFVAAMFGFAFMGGEFSNVRYALNERHRELKKAMSKIEELAITDELTGLYNRRYLMQVLAQQKALANRSHYQFVLCFIDLDHFKKVNDQYGHPFGDKVLIAFSELMQQSLREVDVGARLGGEEFILVLADTSIDAAHQVCERMRMKWMETEFKEAPGLVLTMSIGVAAYKPAERIEDTMERVDQLLYEAKHSGRNCIIVEQLDLQGTLDLI